MWSVVLVEVTDTFQFWLKSDTLQQSLRAFSCTEMNGKEIPLWRIRSQSRYHMGNPPWCHNPARQPIHSNGISATDVTSDIHNGHRSNSDKHKLLRYVYSSNLFHDWQPNVYVIHPATWYLVMFLVICGIREKRIASDVDNKQTCDWGVDHVSLKCTA
jgi:hypothetical protein